MSYFLGFDGGGTKTDCVLMDSEGHVLASVQGGPSNPVRIGYPKAWFALSAAADAVLARARLRSTDIAGIHAGIGGAGRHQVARRVKSFFEKSFPNAAVLVTSDLEVALAATAGEGPGVILVAGTGSAAYGRNSHGDIARSGGMGPWISDEGSGFDIGRRALKAVTDAADFRGPQTQLSQVALAELDCRDWDSIYDRITKNADDVFPRLFPVVVKTADSGDEVARAILADAAKFLAGLAQSVVDKLGMREAEFPLAKIGGVFGRTRLLDEPLDAALARIAPHAHIGSIPVSSAQAAARLAMNAGRETAHAG